MIVTIWDTRLAGAIRAAAPIAGLELDERQARILGRAAARTLAQEPGARPVASQAEGPELQPSDHRLLELVAEGLDNTQIAWRLKITHAAARNRVSVLMRRVGVENRVQLVAWGFEWGVLPRVPEHSTRKLPAS